MLLAERIARAAHAGQLDQAGSNYITHPQRVAQHLERAGQPETVVAAGWLHDVIEDTPTTLDDLASAGIPSDTLTIVDAMTKRNGETSEQYADRLIMAGVHAVAVKRADIADNTDPARLAQLDEATQLRLTAKYQRMLALLTIGG